MSVTGDLVERLPEVRPAEPGATDALGRPSARPFGTVHARFTLAATLGHDHGAVTADALPADLSAAPLAPDALLGPCWPVVYAALGSVVEDGMPLIEGLLGAVHLDHTVDLRRPLAELAAQAGNDLGVFLQYENPPACDSGEQPCCGQPTYPRTDDDGVVHSRSVLSWTMSSDSLVSWLTMSSMA